LHRVADVKRVAHLLGCWENTLVEHGKDMVTSGAEGLLSESSKPNILEVWMSHTG